MTSSHTRVLAISLAVAVGVALPGCGDERGDDRWVTTEDATVDIDWDAIGRAYREAEGPRDFEIRVNEIYAGDEVVSVAVKDVDETSQLVTGFFDRDTDGKVSEGEQIFTITRQLVDEGQGQYQIAGHGPYAGYHSPVWDIAAGMFMGSMMARMFNPGIGAMYASPYVTPAARRGELMSHRDAFRRANPDKFAAQSKSGRAYGRKGGAFGGGRTAPPPRMPSRGGGRFGARSSANRPAVRLLA